ncbi:MAG: threonine--tRNA ligase [Candidatus Portnoybacteria bacterium RBG_13_40_8]|uniref:Threonine--tRNA ligase n=1 Tax=Candidatus Portnoybacteria bacterium RBG_13_40_8 TaxID=1801990 RepID=A0A1G2F2S5_9BACT|nr:MAG: threonine--tRNA ligase [Candidatus Portnoybacteria bacterium RBG_13_40_8]OGZ34719.1 MAG: threonine--tRNA ligase [Candidatus Portnoybacteria bacterium RIFCSPHIGHO2_01_FULL_39_19]
MKIDTIRHSISHIMAQAVKDIFRDVKFAIGPTIENGFYYDFGLSQTLTPEDLPKIEKRMRELIKQNIKFEKKLVSKTEASKLFKNQPFKLELIKDLKTKRATIYKSGGFTDLCAGPHVKSSKEINHEAFKLIKIAGAYWQGDEKNLMLQRIYGVAFETRNELDTYLKQIEEAEKRDHRVLGQRLDLFSIDEEVGPGLILWHPKGAMLRQTIEDFWIKEHLANGYEIIRSPHVGRIKLWQTSGHTNFYKENMFGPMEVEGDKYLIKPMNCPFHMKIYKTQTRSYRDLPLRWAELGTVYRYERSGVLHGLVRVRGFTQDDAHIICTPEQLSDEVMRAVKFGIKLLKDFGFKEYGIYLATRPKDFVGTAKNWDKAIETLKFVLNKLKLKYQIDEGGGVFYGPKIDIKIKDSLGREWQCTTVQFDFNLPERFDLVYIDDKGKKQRPYMVHRALLGSLERFVGVLLEHHAGALPLWLSPVQIYVIPVGSRHEKYAHQIGNDLIEKGFRIKIKDENETVSKKIREGEMQKIPYMLVVGDAEQKAKSVRVRTREKGDIGMKKMDKFIKELK